MAAYLLRVRLTYCWRLVTDTRTYLHFQVVKMLLVPSTYTRQDCHSELRPLTAKHRLVIQPGTRVLVVPTSKEYLSTVTLKSKLNSFHLYTILAEYVVSDDNNR